MLLLFLFLCIVCISWVKATATKDIEFITKQTEAWFSRAPSYLSNASRILSVVRVSLCTQYKRLNLSNSWRPCRSPSMQGIRQVRETLTAPTRHRIVNYPVDSNTVASCLLGLSLFYTCAYTSKTHYTLFTTNCVSVHSIRLLNFKFKY